jgi:two-component system, response regulator PdtaR
LIILNPVLKHMNAKEQKEKNIESAREIIQALSKIGEAITSDLYLEDILKLIVAVTAEVMDSKICTLMLLDTRKKELVIKATQSISKDYINKNPIKLGEGIAGKVALENKAEAIHNISETREYKYHDIARKEGLASLLCVPLHVKGKVVGVLTTYTSKSHHFSEYETHILQTVADQAAIVIENYRLVVETKVIKEELESRKAIERAKGILMKEQGLSEGEAFKKIQKFAMNNRKSMREVADAIVLSSEMKNDNKS